jgi:hypothetical protein
MRLASSIAIMLFASTPALAEVPVDATVVTAPVGAESGRVDEIDESPSTMRLIGRGILFVPRTIVDVAFLPVRGGLYLFDRFQLVDRFKRIFFNDAMTMGLYPTAEIDSGYGLNAGARFVHKNLFGKQEQVALRANIGGRFQQRVNASIRTGDRLGDRVALELGGELERRPKDAYFGIGNDGPGIETRHRQQLLRATSALDLRLMGDFHARFAGSLSDLEYGESEYGLPMSVAYDTSQIPGWDGVRNVYSELEIRWDSRGRASEWESPVLVSSGALGAVFAGRVHQLGMASDYWRFGADIQHFWWLGSGPRVIVTRLHVESVTEGDVSFTELPQLGGKHWLRGYDADRFRDRIAALGSIEYQWDLSRHLSASLFVDAGRVFPTWSELSFEGLRVGYGLGFTVQSTRSFVAEASIASSKDGGVFLNVAFDPVFTISPREGRR